MFLDDLLDPIDRGFLALLKKPGGFLAAQAGERTDAVVADRREMPGGPRCHSAGDAAAVDNDHLLALRHQLIGNGQASDACADDDGVATEVALEARGVRGYRLMHPKGSRGLVARVHQLMLRRPVSRPL